ncbi:hypothetical protein PN497_16935 [Sphaerospermopsis kisseleviana CS-549]|uniref:Sporulation domain-containing protein n=2 Tax=Sphaerospermopsis TaxID=752201 RepID=A0A480A0Z0_9CYAN|nr:MULTISPECIES: hypothetical protein [Sphaerospermopsis]MBD2144891.1 hypothetical protein [Sphaerospermopsis sp. FACHB-1194]MDB9443033.1 hypothetical protein [Sphaerospermopsis kisseleviana CS-549]BAZ81971.1 hypothetical protein NIES73_32410 [Sphaerospermopsis kisseleviana NIES-73]GCL38660.1 hypothetical protein SR1949_37780 [Sphaerospermopsis reniformis]
MSHLITRQITTVPVISLLVGGCLMLTCEDSLAQTRLPELQPAVEFYQNNQNYQTSQPTQISQYGQNFERYVVYVDSDNSQILQQVRQIESSAYIRPFNGRNIIQSGVFSKPSNAQQRVRELELNGISGARILSFSNPEQISYFSGREVPYSTGDNFRNVSPSVQREQSRYYYVIIPTSSNNLPLLGREIRQKIDGNTNVFMRTQPRGAHIAVGGFRERQEAEQWNNYLRNLGYANARVYYGR